MISTDARLNPHLETALQRVRTAAEQAAERCAEGLGLSALSAGMIKRRDALLAAQLLFRKQQGQFAHGFAQSLREQIGPEKAGGKGAPVQNNWTELSLMDDEQVDALVAADRIGLAIGHQSEWELREVESYVAGLQLGERHPLRPEAIGQALLSAVHQLTDDAQSRQILVDELTRAMAQEMRACYADIAGLFRSRGLRPQDLRVRPVDSASGAAANSRAQALNSVSGADLGRELGRDSRSGGNAGPSGTSALNAGVPSGTGGLGSGGAYSFSPAAHPSGPVGGLGAVDPQLMDLLRRLAQAASPLNSGSNNPSTGAGSSAWGELGPGSTYGPHAGTGSRDWHDEFLSPSQAGHLPANLIHQHRDELRQAATGRLDHMVIDVVASLFDQVLSDPKVPPQMARLLARLQLPVLRAALGDPTFFSQRRHPVRLFVNRMASLACAYDDFSVEPGRSFLGHVRALVEELVNGDFERMDVFEGKLAALEQFIVRQIHEELQTQGALPEMLARQEVDLRLQQSYARQLATTLQPVPTPEFLREFLASTWSQAIMRAARDPHGAPERVQRFQKLGQALIISVQPKGRTAERQVFLAQLPSLMATLGEGLDLIAWPEVARKEFFAALLPAHAESLKGHTPTPLETNLLNKQLAQVFGAPLPTEQDVANLATSSLSPDVDPAQGLSASEVQGLGLMTEAQVDWNGELDIDLSAEPALQAVDISIDGLPAAAEAPEPSEGELLVDNLHVGFSYQMRSGERWQKVRLAHISEGRSFFIFTHGAKHQETVTMTARMLKRLCEAKRLRAFENAYLLERAMARTRKQLAEISSKKSEAAMKGPLRP
ncbi:DUF1631 family protein [Roseateles koreensis]|uniref:DUF1631 family protein n=1 Tax=Roseateles koreensis TaxID=2987526 RepID=A0ABT5KSE8_9BURK|nr:DUF1631 family protein [Roseateles koreensis]MDC8785864.1 DUF1631 family protein [Roseateles koreensis]